jgi:hypothetical protein
VVVAIVARDVKGVEKAVNGSAVLRQRVREAPDMQTQAYTCAHVQDTGPEIPPFLLLDFRMLHATKPQVLHFFACFFFF